MTVKLRGHKEYNNNKKSRKNYKKIFFLINIKENSKAKSGKKLCFEESV